MTYKPSGLKPWERIPGINIGSTCAIIGGNSPIPTPENKEFRCITYWISNSQEFSSGIA